MKILLISNNEICYNARLLKAADFFSTKGYEVTVFNPVTGISSAEVYKNSIANKNWKIIENDISKRTVNSYARWLYISIINKFISICWNKFRLKFGFIYYMNKGLLGAKRKIESNFDFILIHLVDNLPFAVELKKKTGARLIYDSQEYFRGQYNKYETPLRDWVHLTEPKYISHVDILLATTTVMLRQLTRDYALKIPAFRVRNVPSGLMLSGVKPKTENNFENDSVKLVWHGMTIYFNNTRGVHILLKAIAACKSNVKLYLQGLINNEQLIIFNDYVKELKLGNKVTLVPPADPYNIVSSLTKYDIGLIGELPQEENQMLTSSNKLFDFINAGLAVIASDMPGLNETIKEYNIGYTYPSGDSVKMAELIDSLCKNKDQLRNFKDRSSEVSQKELFWEHDYEAVWKEMSSKT
ncbi:MAG: glycosyltransferase [Bacteroidetes bacterium]|nr:glycosyltransferase [Bacteroidota bacterium]